MPIRVHFDAAGAGRGEQGATPSQTARLATASVGAAYRNKILVAIAALFFGRLIFAALVPLAGDESLYWRYSRHLAWGFVDHPPVNPFLIHVGTSLFGDTPFGVRVCNVLLGIPATWAVWSAARLLFRRPGIGATAALLFNLTLALSVGGMAATSDMPVMLGAALLMAGLAKLDESGSGIWWLAVGAAFGLGMLSKYTTGFFAISILIWLCVSRENRRWVLTPWPWLAGAVAACMFAPVFIWNAQHEWASFGYQSNRMVVHDLSLQYPLELIASQVILATPSVLALGVMGAIWGLSTDPASGRARLLLLSLAGPIPLYFFWHAFHQRVQGNWPEPAYPALAVLAAIGVSTLRERQDAIGRLARWSAISALPVGAGIALLASLHAAFGILPLGARDPAARVLAVGLPEMAAQVEEARQKIGAPVVLVTDYTLAGWLDFYLPPETPVEQINERIRWVDAPLPAQELFKDNTLYVCKADCSDLPGLRRRFRHVEHLEDFARRRRDGALISLYSAYRLSDPVNPVLDSVYPAMNFGVSA